MEFESVTENEMYLKIELKYCERCGGLFFRRHGSDLVYCVTCGPEVAQIARGRKKRPACVRWSDLRGGVACA
jgi:ribosomal protein S27AE